MSLKRVYQKEVLEKLVKESLSISQVCKKIGINPNGSSNTHLKHVIKYFGIDISHFLGRKANSGIYHNGFKGKRALDVLVLQTGTIKVTRATLHRCLQEIGREYICEVCKNKPVWNKKTLTLTIHHINGNSYDHRAENLQYLCPNCHSQTENYCGKNVEFKKIKKPIDTSWRHKPKLDRRKVERPPLDILLDKLKNSNYCAVGREYGVSDNAIRKWIKYYNASVM